MNKEDRHKLACENFLARHPEIKAEIDALSAKEAECMGMSLLEFREQKLAERLQEHAGYAGKPVADFVIDLAARTESERKTMLVEMYKEIAECSGMEWKEYCDLNPHIRKLEE